jgi:hypothetical protein
MSRTYVYEHDAALSDDAARYVTRAVGWFDPDTADYYPEATRWDGSNNVSIATGSQWHHQGLYRTRGGRWVLESWSQWANSGPVMYRFLDAPDAADWLRFHGHTEAVTLYFGADTQESGPPVTAASGIRNVRVPDELWDAALAATSDRGTTVSAVLRDALRVYVAA